MEAIEHGMEMPQEEGLFLEATLFGLCCATEDMREGTKAFLEKRAGGISREVRWIRGTPFLAVQPVRMLQNEAQAKVPVARETRDMIQPGKIDGALSGAGFRFGIVISRFNSFITERLLQGALDALERGGAAGKDVEVVHVPGSFELPLAAKKLAATGRYDAVIAIGCILRGETAHYDYVCSETARGLQLAQMDTGMPVDVLCAHLRHAGAGH